MSLVRFRPEAPPICGFSSFGRASPCQGEGGGFEPRNPLQRKSTDPIGRCFFFGKEYGSENLCKALALCAGAMFYRRRMPLIKLAIWRRRRQIYRALVTKGSAVLFWRLTRHTNPPARSGAWRKVLPQSTHLIRLPVWAATFPSRGRLTGLRCGVLPFTAF